MRRGRQDNKSAGPRKPSPPPGTNKHHHQKHNNTSHQTNNSNNKKKAKSPPPTKSIVAKQIQNHQRENNSNNNNNNKHQHQNYSSTNNITNHNNNTETLVKMMIRASTVQSWGIQIFDLTNGHQNKHPNKQLIRYKVEDVDEFSPAFHSGIKREDVIVGVLPLSDKPNSTIFIRDFNDFGAFLSQAVSIQLKIERKLTASQAAHHQGQYDGDAHKPNYPLPPTAHSHHQSQNSSSSSMMMIPQQQESPSKTKKQQQQLAAKAEQEQQQQISPKKQQQANNKKSKSSGENNSAVVTMTALPSPPSSVHGNKHLGWLHALLAPAVALPESIFGGTTTTGNNSNSNKNADEQGCDLRFRTSAEIEAEGKYLSELMKV